MGQEALVKTLRPWLKGLVHGERIQHTASLLVGRAYGEGKAGTC